jgi:hypothetical protein
VGQILNRVGDGAHAFSVLHSCDFDNEGVHMAESSPATQRKALASIGHPWLRISRNVTADFAVS